MKKIIVGTLFATLTYVTAAGAVGQSGVLCQPGGSNGAVYYAPTGTQNPLSGPGQSTYLCPVPVGSNVGSIQWTFQVYDGNSTGQVSCRGFTYDSTGNLVTSTAFVGSGAAFIGATTLTPPDGPASSSTYHYVGECDLPGFQTGQSNSEVRRLDVF
jgi:hypothetical protein